MESNSKTIAALMLLLALSGCAWMRPLPVAVVPPRPVVDARLLEICNTGLTSLDARGVNPGVLLESYGEAVARLGECACRVRATHNLLCELVADCTPVVPCGPKS